MIHVIVAAVIFAGSGWAQSQQNPDLGEQMSQLGAQVNAGAMSLRSKKQSVDTFQMAEEDIGPLPADLNNVKNEPLSAEEQARIIKGAAQREQEMKKARDSFMYGYYVDVESLKEYRAGNFKIMDQDPPYTMRNYTTQGKSYREKAHIVFTSDGQPKKHVDWAPQDTLSNGGGRQGGDAGCFDVDENDIPDVIKIFPFLFSQDDIGIFNTEYKGTEKIGQADTYVYFVAPKHMEKNHRYYEGYVFIEKSSLEVVVLHGKAVPDTKNNLYPRFTTYLNTEELSTLGDRTPNPRLAKSKDSVSLADGTTCDRLSICGEYTQKLYRFPIKTIAADVLEFPGRDCPIFESVDYFDYQEFGAKSSGQGEVEAVTPTPKTTTPPQQEPKQ